MYASAVLTVSTVEDALSIPVAALEDRAGETVVYTGYVEKDNQLTAPVSVATGIFLNEYSRKFGIK